MFKKISIILILVVFMVSCSKPSLSPEEMKKILESTRSIVEKDGLYEPVVYEFCPPLDPLLTKSDYVAKQWIWGYTFSINDKSSGVISCGIRIVRFSHPRNYPEFFWVIFVKTRYFPANVLEGIGKYTDDRFYLKGREEVFLEHKQKPNYRDVALPGLKESDQILVDILWLAVQDFHKNKT